MRGKELAGPADQQVVQLRFQPAPFGQPEIAAYSIELRSPRRGVRTEMIWRRASTRISRASNPKAGHACHTQYQQSHRRAPDRRKSLVNVKV